MWHYCLFHYQGCIWFYTKSQLESSYLCVSWMFPSACPLSEFFVLLTHNGTTFRSAWLQKKVCACDDTSELYSTKPFTPADLFIKQQKPPQTRRHGRFKGETFIQVAQVFFPPKKIFYEQIFKTQVFKHSINTQLFFSFAHLLSWMSVCEIET